MARTKQTSRRVGTHAAAKKRAEAKSDSRKSSKDQPSKKKKEKVYKLQEHDNGTMSVGGRTVKEVVEEEDGKYYAVFEDNTRTRVGQGDDHVTRVTSSWCFDETDPFVHQAVQEVKLLVAARCIPSQLCLFTLWQIPFIDIPLQILSG